jgi:hypothetical protein
MDSRPVLWIDVISGRYELQESIQFTAKELKGAYRYRNAGYVVTSANSFGIYKFSYIRRQDQRQAGQIRVTAYEMKYLFYTASPPPLWPTNTQSHNRYRT